MFELHKNTPNDICLSQEASDILCRSNTRYAVD